MNFRDLVEAAEKVFVASYITNNGKYEITVYVKAKNENDALNKCKKHKVSGAKFDSVEFLSTLKELEDDEIEMFDGDFAEFEAESID